MSELGVVDVSNPAAVLLDECRDFFEAVYDVSSDRCIGTKIEGSLCTHFGLMLRFDGHPVLLRVIRRVEVEASARREFSSGMPTKGPTDA